MAVVPMKYVSILGPINMFESFVLKHVINSNVELEPSFKSLNIRGLIPFEEDQTFNLLQKRMRILNERIKSKVRLYEKDKIESVILDEFDMEASCSYIDSLEKRFDQYKDVMASLSTEIQEREQIIKQIAPISGLDVDIDELFHFSYMKFRFGSMPKENLMKQRDYLDQLDVVYVPVSEESDHIWLSYFMPAQISPIIDNVFSALGFERIRISDQVKGLPKLAIEKMTSEINLLKQKVNLEESEINLYMENERENFILLFNRVLYRDKINELKSLSAHTKEIFFIVGWLPYADYKRFVKEVEPMDEIIFSSEDPDYVTTSTPPTIMKNSKFFKPFETFVTLYGLPSAREMDPTKFVMLTYIFMFGFMFGDVGQGLIIGLIGLYLYAFKKQVAMGILFYLGISSTIFGFLYGSVFGSENIINPLFISPLHDKASINTILVISAVYGVVIILVTIIANIINCFRLRNWGRMIFDKNGIAGLMFYGGIVVCVLISLAAGKIVITTVAIIVVVVIPVILLFFREPLENILRHKEHIMPHGKGMYFVEAAFELFETALNFFSGTLSFLRVGAFALNHAGLSLAVWTLYSMMSGFGGIIVVIIGNIVTIVLEGLIVGIQCLRLEYYEMFGRFYTGEGHEFKPVRVTDE